MGKYSIDLLKEGVLGGHTRAMVLFVRLKGLYRSGRIRSFETDVDHRKFGYITKDPFKKDVIYLMRRGFLTLHGRRTATKEAVDVQLVGTRTLHQKLFQNKKSCEIRLDPRSKNLREQIHAAILQDSLYKQEYKARRSSMKNVKHVLVINTAIKMDRAQPRILDQSSLTTISFKSIAKKLGYKSAATAHKAMEKMISMGLFKKFNQAEKVSRGGYNFKGLTSVRVLSNIYEVPKSVLPDMCTFSKIISI